MLSLNRREIFFYIGWFFFSISVIFGLTEFVEIHEEWQLFFKLIRYMGYAFCCVKIFDELIEKRKIYLTVLFVIVLFVSCVNSTNKTMLLYSIIMIAANDMNGKKIMKMSLYIQGMSLFFVVILSQFGIFHDYLFIRDEGRYRHALGFSWTTTAPILFFFFLLIYFYLKKNKVNLLITFSFAIINVWFYVMTNSRMAFALSFVFILFMIIQKGNRSRWKWICKWNKLYKFLPEITCVMSLIMFKFYDESISIWFRLNSILSDRLHLGVNAINQYGFSLFGKTIEWVGFSIKNPTMEDAIGYNYVDSSYLQLGLNYGIVFLCIVLLIYSAVMNRAIKRKDYYLVSIITIILIFSITEPRLMNLAFNPFPLLAFCKLEEN